MLQYYLYPCHRVLTSQPYHQTALFLLGCSENPWITFIHNIYGEQLQSQRF